MILPGRSVVTRQIVNNLISPALQSQPCGVDLTLKRVFNWTSAGVVNFDNSRRKTANTKDLPFKPILPEPTPHVPVSSTPPADDDLGFIDLAFGSYLVEFNETVDVPFDMMGQVFVRSSLFRSGALVHAGVIDSGYQGVVGALLQVGNPEGLRLYRNAKAAQLVFMR
jgi:dUTP pyrophosphatase